MSTYMRVTNCQKQSFLAPPCTSESQTAILLTLQGRPRRISLTLLASYCSVVRAISMVISITRTVAVSIYRLMCISRKQRVSTVASQKWRVLIHVLAVFTKQTVQHQHGQSDIMCLMKFLSTVLLLVLDDSNLKPT